ncbi:unnamed protein product, partial [Amoebophrya sp. A25]|eukprot:GSA25T00000562001.1
MLLSPTRWFFIHLLTHLWSEDIFIQFQTSLNYLKQKNVVVYIRQRVLCWPGSS